MWDERYSGEAFVYGEAPNDFLREAARFVLPRVRGATRFFSRPPGMTCWRSISRPPAPARGTPCAATRSAPLAAGWPVGEDPTQCRS